MSYSRCILPVVFFLLVAFGCRKETPPEPPGPPPYVQSISLDTLSVDVTEVLLRVRAIDTSGAAEVSVYRDSVPVFTGQPSRGDTTLLDTALAPARLYSYKAYRLQNTQRIDSVVLAVRTMDTTTHNFTWQVQTLGDGASSVLYDVAIINDTLVYAVGAIYLRDSLGNWDPNAYNAVKWDGTSWELKRIAFMGACSAVLYPPLRAIWAFSATNILVTNGGSIVRYDGVNATMDCGMNQLLSGAMNKIYATSPQHIYAVGNAGTIVHYNGTTWQRIESGTDVDLLDVWGSPDGSVVWACGWEDFKPTVLLTCRAGNWEKVYEDPNPFTLRQDSLSGILTGVWSRDARRLYVASHYGLYKCPGDTRGRGRRSSFVQSYFPGFPFRMRGGDVNDIWIVGEFFMIAHYNGATWRHFDQFMDADGRLYSVAQEGNLVIGVGLLYDPIDRRGMVYRGTR